MLFTLPTGLTNDRIPSKRIIQLGLVLLIIEFIGLSTTQYFPAVILLMLMGSTGGHMFTVSMDSLFYKTAGKQSPIYRIKTYVGFALLASGLGVFFGGNILGYLDFQKYLLVVAGLLTLLLIGSTLLPKTDTFKFDILNYKQDIFKPHILLFISIIFCFAIHMGSELTSYGPFLRENLGLSFPQMGLYMGAAIATMFISIRISAKAVEKGVKMQKIVTLGLLTSGIGYLIMLNSFIPISFAGRVIHEAGDAMMFVFLYMGVSEFFKKERVGGNSGLITFTQMSGILTGSLIFGPVGAAYGYQVPIIISSITTLLALLLLKEYEKHYINRNAR